MAEADYRRRMEIFDSILDDIRKVRTKNSAEELQPSNFPQRPRRSSCNGNDSHAGKGGVVWIRMKIISFALDFLLSAQHQATKKIIHLNIPVPAEW